MDNQLLSNIIDRLSQLDLASQNEMIKTIVMEILIRRQTAIEEMKRDLRSIETHTEELEKIIILK